MLDQHKSPVMSVQECAHYLKIGRSHAYEMVREGVIPHVRLGRKILIPIAAVDRMLFEAGQQRL